MDAHLTTLVFWLPAILAALLVYGVGLALYRIFFHPLAKYPGPWAAKVSDVYMLYYAWKGDRHLEFWRLHERYGPVVRFGPNNISFNSSSALKEIYGFHANVRKAEFYEVVAHPAPSTLNVRDKETHSRKKRVLSQVFSDSAMKEMERYIVANIETFCDEIGRGSDSPDRKGWSSPKNMADWFSYLTMDILGDLCFGKAFHMLEKPDNRYAIGLVGAATKRQLLCGTMPMLSRLGLDKMLFSKIAAGRLRYIAYSRAQLSERTKLGAEIDRRDFFYHLLKARDPETGVGLSMSELWGESSLLIIAGSDTTSTAMAATLFYLVRNLPCLARVTEEVRSAFESVEDIHQSPRLAGCLYLRSCVDEAMRLSPSVGGPLPREVQAGGIQIDGHYIPEGTVVGTPQYAIHHNPEYFPQPFAYVPERWTVGASMPGRASVVTEDDVRRSKSAFCPFSIGPRGCIGKSLAYSELLITLARVLYRYDLRRAVHIEDPGEGHEDAEWGRHRPEEYQLVDAFTSLKDGPMIEFRERAL